MTRFVYALFLLLVVLPAIGRGQFNSPSINASNRPTGVWGGSGDPNNYVSGATTWYLTWDNDNLYVFIASANEAEGAVMYLDVDPIVPVNGGSNADGNLVGQTYDNSRYANLPFRADIAIYFKNDYREIRRRDGSGGWTLAHSGASGFSGSGTNDYAGTADAIYSSCNGCTVGSNNRSFRIRWSRLLGSINGGTLPSAFNWIGKVVFPNAGLGGVYAAVPVFNPSGGSVGTAASASWYISVISTADGQNGATPNPAVGRSSYTFVGGSDISSFGALSVHDMTINNAGRFLSRGSGGGNWTIGGSLVVNAGTLFFGPSGSFGTTSVNNLVITGGTLDMDATNQALNVSGGLNMTGGTLELSNTIGGDLNLTAGNWSRSSGTFTPNGRAVGFNGTSANQSIANAETFAFLSTNKPGFQLQANGNLTVTNGLTLTAGNLNLQGNQLELGTSSTVASLSLGSGQVTNGTVRRFVNTSTAALTIPFFVGTADRSMTVQFAASNAAGAAVTVGHSDYRSSLIHPGLEATDFTNAALVAAGITSAAKVAPIRWEVVGTLITQPYTITLSATGLNTVADPNLLRVLRRSTSTSPYALAGTHVSGTGSLGNYSVTSSGVSGFSDLTVANGGPELLPVTWLHLSARRVGGGAEVSWTTASETNNERFEVERSSSIDFARFDHVVTLAGAGTTQEARSYRFVDAELGGGTTFYRIRQVDLDGQSSRSPVVRLIAAGESTARILVYPTVLTGDALQLVSLDGAALAEQPLRARLVAADGRLLWQGEGRLAELQARANAALAGASPGLIVLQLEGETLRQHTRLIRQ